MKETKYGTTPTNEMLKYGMKFGFQRMCIVHESIIAMVRHFFSIYIDVYYLILQFSLFSPMYIKSLQFIFMFVDRRWRRRKQSTPYKTFLKITQVMEVAHVVATIQVKNDDHYFWISRQGLVFFEIFVSEIKHFV